MGSGSSSDPRPACADVSWEIGAAYREVVGPHFPVMTAVEVANFVEPGARVEIEATAVVPE